MNQLRSLFRKIANKIARKVRIKFFTLRENYFARKNFYSRESPKGSIYPLIVCFIRKGYMIHGGLADRLKMIVGTYYLAKRDNIPFRVFYDDAFDIRKYLLPNKVQWNPLPGEISFRRDDTILMTYTHIAPPPQ